MKNKFVFVSLSLLSCVALCACGGEGTSSTNNGSLAAVSNISINYSDSTYSFTGVENASSYYIKVYTVTNGVEDSVLTYMSDKIVASSDLPRRVLSTTPSYAEPTTHTSRQTEAATLLRPRPPTRDRAIC